MASLLKKKATKIDKMKKKNKVSIQAKRSHLKPPNIEDPTNIEWDTTITKQ